MQTLVIALGQRVDNGYHKIADHGNNERLKDLGQHVAGIASSASTSSTLLAMQALLLVLEERLERLLQLVAEHWDCGQQVDRPLNESLVEGNDYEDLLDVHLDHGLANERGSEEGPEWHQKMAASYASQVKKGIGNLQGKSLSFS